MDYEDKILVGIFIGAALILLGVLAMRYASPLSIAATPQERVVVAFGQNWTVSAPEDDFLPCRLGVDNYATAKSSVTADASGLRVQTVTPETGNKDCRYKHAVTIRLDQDLRDVQSLTVMRKGVATAAGTAGMEVTTSTNELSRSSRADDASQGYPYLKFSSVSVTRSGDNIVIESDEGRQVITPEGPVYLVMGAFVDNGRDESRQGGISIEITGLRLTPLAQVPLVTTEPVVPTVEQPVKPSSWLATLWGWIVGVFS